MGQFRNNVLNEGYPVSLANWDGLLTMFFFVFALWISKEYYMIFSIILTHNKHFIVVSTVHRHVIYILECFQIKKVMTTFGSDVYLN